MLTLPATLNHAQASSSQASGVLHANNWVEQARAAHWQVDASQLQNFDSSALALLLDLQRSASAANARLTIHNAPAQLTQLATLYGVNELIT